MVDFITLANRKTKQPVIFAPRRSHRPNETLQISVCPFCPGREKTHEEVYRVGGKKGDSNWDILVIKNRYPFTPYHEVVIHSPDHHKNIDELSFAQVVLLLQTYRDRMRVHMNDGLVYIFHNKGHSAGESIPHPHSQVTIVSKDFAMDIPRLDAVYHHMGSEKKVVSEECMIFCPDDAQWPDEVWIAPQRAGTRFRDSSDALLSDVAFVLARVIQLLDMRHGHEFPFNFYIYPGKDWYIRVIPRVKILGGFEVGTGVMVNTQMPTETLHFFKEHFWEPDYKKIMLEGKAAYEKHV